MARTWQPPLDIEISNRSKPVKDFVSWMLSAPAVSERAKACLEPLVGKHVEFLPLIKVKTKQLFAMNVLQLIDCLDVVKSQIHFSSSEPGRTVSVFRFVFDPARLRHDPVIFRVPEDMGYAFISQSVVDVITAKHLTGSVLINPGGNPFAGLLPGDSDALRPI